MESESDFCKVCEHPNHETLERLFLLGEVQLPEAAKQLGVDIPEFWHHIRTHLEEAEKEPKFNRDERIRIMDKCLYYVYKKARALFNSPNEPDVVRSLTSLVQQLRGLARDVAILEGDVKLGTEINLQQVNIRIGEMQTWMVANACMSCKKKFVEHLERVEALPNVT